VLEHPDMTWHPPILYLGLVATLVPGLRAIVGTASSARTWAVVVGLLTIGLATGARWAHLELGWGGYWAWDPIESAGLVVWLAAVAALHAASIRSTTARTEATAAGNTAAGNTAAESTAAETTAPLRPLERLVLAGPMVAAVWATTLTRVGLVSSVHAFADNPGLRRGLIGVAVGLSVVVLGSAVSARSVESRLSQRGGV